MISADAMAKFGEGRGVQNVLIDAGGVALSQTHVSI